MDTKRFCNCFWKLAAAVALCAAVSGCALVRSGVQRSARDLRCAGKAGNPFQTTQGNPFQTTQGNRHSCRHQEGRRGSEEAVPGPSVFPSGEPGVSGNFWGSHERCLVLFRTSDGNWDFP